MTDCILALDQGTTSSRAILFDRQRKIVGVAQKEFSQKYPREGWVEHDPMEIYSSISAVMSEALANAGVPASAVKAIGIANQRETTILWDRASGLPVYNAIVWQCRRTAQIISELERQGYGDYIREVTGLVPDAYFSGSKIKWILDNVPGVRARAENGGILFGTVDSWLIWKLTGGQAHVTDYTNASRTMIYNINTLDWDERLLTALNIPRSILPEVCDSSMVYGYTSVHGYKIPIAGAAGDQQAALFGQCCFDDGEAKNTYGTGCFMLMNTGVKPFASRHGLISTIAVGINGKIQYALEGSVFVGGAVIQWLRDELRFFDDSKDAEYFASKAKDNGGVYIVPAFTGLGAPHWDMYARGCLIGITRGTKREHIIRAAQESIAYQSYDLVRAIESDTGMELKELRADGGASRDDFLMQFQADILGKPLIRPLIRETTALGAAYLAGLAVGLWNLDELKQSWQHDVAFEPNMAKDVRERLLRNWNKAVGRSLGWAENI